MDLTTLLSTTTGKAIVGAAVAAAGLGGLTAAGAVELPDLPGQAVEVGETPPNPDEVVGQTPAAEQADPQAETDADETEADETEAEEVTEAEVTETSAVESRTDDEGGDLPGVDGASVAADAQDGGVDGAQVSEAARAGTPAEDHVTAEEGTTEDAGAPEEAGAPGEPGAQADEHRPAAAGRP